MGQINKYSSLIKDTKIKLTLTADIKNSIELNLRSGRVYGTSEQNKLGFRTILKKIIGLFEINTPPPNIHS